MSKKRVIELEEEVGQLQADLSGALDELEKIKVDATAEVDRLRKQLHDDALAKETTRQDELKEATAHFSKIMATAKEIHKNISEQEPKLLGIAGQAAREGQLVILKEIFGEL